MAKRPRPSAEQTSDVTADPAGEIEAKPAERAAEPAMPLDAAPLAPASEANPAEAPGSPISVTDDFAAKVEAVVLSADRPVPAQRVGEALGIIPSEDEETGGDDAPAAASAILDGEPGDQPPAPAPSKASRRASTAAKIREAQRVQGLAQVEAAVDHLNAAYERTGRSFRIERVAGGLRVMTLPTFAPVIAEFHRARLSAKLSRPAVETLAIIAYKQPITRAQLEAIRGVSCGEVLRSLIDRKLVTVRGRAEELGRPLLYGTTRPFLDHFGLESIKDLPTIAELKPTGV